jgi:phospholipid/cholesterol/gamma-HCH transport system substrate-binding protein
MPATDEEEIRDVTLSPWAGTRVTALIGFALGLALVLIYLMTGGGQALLHRTVIIRTYMADGTGLVRTANVELNGIKVGKVRRVSLSHFPDAERAVQVDLKIRKDYLSAIPVDSKAELTADNLLGDKYINIRKGSSSQPIEPGMELGAQPPTANFDPADLLASLQTILERANDMLGQIEDPSTPLGLFVKGEDFYGQLRDNFVGIQTTLHKYANPKTGIGQTLYGQALYQEMRQKVLDIDKQIEAVQTNPMLVSSANYDAWMAQAKSFHQVVGSFRNAPMMKQDDFYNNTRDALKSLDDTVAAMSAGTLLTSTQLYESLNGTSRNTRTFLHDFRLNPQKYLRLKVF